MEEFVVLTWMCDKREHYAITQSQHCSVDNTHNANNVVRASVWVAFFGGLF